MRFNSPIVTALILIAAVPVGFFLVTPKYNEFRDLRETEGEKKGEFNAKYDYYSQVTKLHEELESRLDDIKKVDDALPANSDFGRLIYYFQQKAAQSGLIAKNIFLSKVGPSDSQNRVKDIVFSLDLLGNYFSLENFVSSLEKSSKLFEVSSIVFTSQSSSGASSQSPASGQLYSFSLEIKTHSY